MTVCRVSQRKIAARLGVPRETIRDWVGNSRMPAETTHPDPYKFSHTYAETCKPEAFPALERREVDQR